MSEADAKPQDGDFAGAPLRARMQGTTEPAADNNPSTRKVFVSESTRPKLLVEACFCPHVARMLMSRCHSSDRCTPSLGCFVGVHQGRGEGRDGTSDCPPPAGAAYGRTHAIYDPGGLQTPPGRGTVRAAREEKWAHGPPLSSRCVGSGGGGGTLPMGASSEHSDLIQRFQTAQGRRRFPVDRGRRKVAKRRLEEGSGGRGEAEREGEGSDGDGLPRTRPGAGAAAVCGEDALRRL